MTVQEFRVKFEKDLANGERVLCRGCGRTGKIQHRPLDRGQVRGLALLYLHDLNHPGEFVHLATFLHERNTWWAG